MGNQRSSYKRLRRPTETNVWAIRFVQSQIHFIYFFYNPGPLCQSLKAGCKANCLNTPHYVTEFFKVLVPVSEKTSRSVSLIQSSADSESD